MIILGIDPGTATTGYGVIESNGSKVRMIDYGCIETKAKIPLAERLEIIHKELVKLIKKHKPKKIAVEELFFFKNAKTVISVSHSRGVVLLASKMNKLEIYEYTPLEVKMALTGYGKADKLQIQKMVKLILALDSIPKPDDAADALAIALCCNSHYNFEERSK